MIKKIKYLILAFSLIFNVLICRAQSEFKFGISMGPVVPIGDFKNIDNNSFNSGYAKTGFSLTVDGNYYIHNRVAISAAFHFGNSAIDGSLYSNRLYNELAAYLPPIEEKSEEVKFTINEWLWAAPLIGAKYNYPVSINKIYVEVGAFTGVSFTQIPDQNLFYLDGKNDREILSQNVEDKVITVPIMLNGGIRFKINKRMQFSITSEYYYTRVDFTHVSYIKLDNSVENTELFKNSFSVPIRTINFKAGLIYNL
ncbi:MAG: outer membrane beta-barrel protein [Prolixibacteraceae bacterium]|nr:outer membrane beta-barrel protein [Prolixibacteraceae bacterium]